MIGSEAEQATSDQTPEQRATTPLPAIRPAKRAASPWVRRIGNLLIVVGVLLMVGVGGYLAWQTYTNSQEAQQIAADHQAAGGIEWLPPTAAPDSGTGGVAASDPAAPVALPAGDTV